ncbi:hypothetical protein ZWY2020_050832 [Hordeum vulgare]|nr:hypothetical protein ZWY2020_050832 [Hordeum vulgare]
MKAAVTLLASSTFLVPRGATAKIANELLPVVAEPENIAEFDFYDYVVEGLWEAARKLRDDLSMDVAIVKLEGCLVVPHIMWLDYHEHGLQGRETLQFPRIGQYSDTKTKDLIRKHATAQGIECGLELGDVPRSPTISVPRSCSKAAHAQVVGGQVMGPASGSRSADGSADMDNLPLLATKVVEAFKATMEFHYKRYRTTIFPAEEYFAQDVEYGFSLFELEFSHADQYPKHVCQNFYEDFIYLSCVKSLSSTWYKSSSPTFLVMDGHKLKYQYNLDGAMYHNDMEAWVRGFNEREKKMFDRVGLPVSRGLLSPDVPLLKRFSVLDPVFTEMTKEDYRVKHGVTIDYMLKGMKYVGEMLEDGWSMHIPEWSVKYNINMHIACGSGESPGYIAYYADNFNRTRLEEDIPQAGLTSRRKRMLYETLPARCNTAPHPGFMVHVPDED